MASNDHRINFNPYPLLTLTKDDKYFYISDKIIIIVPNYIEYWDNFYYKKYSDYLKQKFIWNLKNINLN